MTFSAFYAFHFLGSLVRSVIKISLQIALACFNDREPQIFMPMGRGAIKVHSIKQF